MRGEALQLAVKLLDRDGVGAPIVGYYRGIVGPLGDGRGPGCRGGDAIEAMVLGEVKVADELCGDGPGKVARAQSAELAGEDTIMHSFGEGVSRYIGGCGLNYVLVPVVVMVACG